MENKQKGSDMLQPVTVLAALVIIGMVAMVFFYQRRDDSDIRDLKQSVDAVLSVTEKATGKLEEAGRESDRLVEANKEWGDRITKLEEKVNAIETKPSTVVSFGKEPINVIFSAKPDAIKNVTPPHGLYVPPKNLGRAKSSRVTN